jgi:hypothetical protein
MSSPESNSNYSYFKNNECDLQQTEKNKLKENCRTFGISDLEVPWPLIPS